MSRLIVALLFFVMALTLFPASALSQVNRSDSAAVLFHAATAFEAEGKQEVAEALYHFISERFGDTPAGEAAREILSRPTTPRASRASQVELQVWTTTYGLWLGVALPAALGADDPSPYGLGLLVGGPGGFLAGRAMARSRPLSEGQVRAITFGGTWGTWLGLGVAELLDWGEEGSVCDLDFCYEDNDNGREIITAMVAGGLAGIATGVALSKKPIPSGLATTVNLGALWGTWFGFGASVLADAEGDGLLGGTMVGGNAGLLATALLAPQWDLSRNRARLISITGVIGGLGGFGLDLLFQPNDDKVAMAIPLATSVAGLVLGAALTREEDGRGGSDAARVDPLSLALRAGLLRAEGGRMRVGVPTLLPRMLLVDGPEGMAWRPALGVTLFQAVF